MYAKMHANAAFKGDTWKLHFARFLHFAFSDEYSPPVKVLDFGCGPTGGLKASLLKKGFEIEVASHDPFIPQFAKEPWKSGFDTFFSTDVFEHMTDEKVADLLLRLRKHISCTKIFVALSTRPANKTLPNGLNAHLTVRPADWWHGTFCATLSGAFDFRIADADLLHGECVFALSRIVAKEEA